MPGKRSDELTGKAREHEDQLLYQSRKVSRPRLVGKHAGRLLKQRVVEFGLASASSQEPVQEKWQELDPSLDLFNT
jgi:hypothetical protein